MYRNFDPEKEKISVEQLLDPLYFSGNYDRMDEAAATLKLYTNKGRGALYYREGFRELQRKDWEAVFDYGQETLRMGDVRGHELLLCYYAHEGKFDLFRDELKAYTPSDLVAVNTALIAFQHKDYVVTVEEIVSYADKIIGDSRNAGHCWNNLAWALSLKGGSIEDYYAALGYFDNAEGIYISNKIARNHRGGLDSRRGQTGLKIGAWLAYPSFKNAVDHFKVMVEKDSSFQKSLDFNTALMKQAEERLGLSLAQLQATMSA